MIRKNPTCSILISKYITFILEHDNRQEGQTISAPASTAVGNVAGSTKETQT